MRCNVLGWSPSVLGALLLTLTALVTPARADGLEVTEVRTDNYPRVIVRFSASAAIALGP